MNSPTNPGAAEGERNIWFAAEMPMGARVVKAEEYEQAQAQITQLESQLREATARADIWEKNYTNCEPKAATVKRLTADLAAANERAERAEVEAIVSEVNKYKAEPWATMRTTLGAAAERIALSIANALEARWDGRPCKCTHTWKEHKKPETKISWEVCSFPCGECNCQEFDEQSRVESASADRDRFKGLLEKALPIIGEQFGNYELADEISAALEGEAK